MDRTTDFGSVGEGSNPSAVTIINLNAPENIFWERFFKKKKFY